MLANLYDSQKHNIDGWFYSEKYDGVRGLWNGSEMISRNGIVLNIPDFIRQELETVVNDDGEVYELDGEIWFGIGNFDLASGQARRFEPDSEIWKSAKYMVFDCQSINDKFKNRYKVLQKLFKNSNYKFIELVEQNIVRDNIREVLKEYLDNGSEGLILKNPESLYEHKRSKNMLKMVASFSDEAIVVGYTKGINKYNNMVGALVVNMNDSTFSVGSGLTDRQRYAKFNKWSDEEVDKSRKNLKDSSVPVIGSVVTIKYKEINKSGKPKHPVFVTVRNYE